MTAPKQPEIATILHIDMNAFFASCEQSRRPELRGRPVIVGENASRSVVSAASYEARKFGIHAGMAAFQAFELCPNAVFLKVDIPYYTKISNTIFEIFHNYSYQVEKAGIDEGFIDVSSALTLFESPKNIAHSIISDVKEATGVDCCVGIATSKSVAKIASGLAKPATKQGGDTGFISDRGVLEILPSFTQEFLSCLRIKVLWGVGRKTQEKLLRLGIINVSDFLDTPQSALINLLGQTGYENVYKLATGADIDPVNFTPSQAKSVGKETTLKQDNRDFHQLNDILVKLCDAVGSELRRKGLQARTVSLVIKTFDHIRHSRAETLESPTNTGFVIHSSAKEQLHKWLKEDVRSIRLIGVSTSNLIDDAQNFGVQTLFQATSESPELAEKMSNVEVTIDQIRKKFPDVLR
jgi:DNA polymerase-4